MIKCTKCNVELPEEAFYLRKTPSGNVVRNRWCKECHKSWNRRYYLDHKEAQDEYRRQWVRKRRKTHYRTYRKYELKKKYGVTLEWYDQQVKLQNGVCAICGNPEKGLHSRFKSPLPLHVDHNHETGEVRGLLCQMCNKTLGFIEGEWHRKAIDYLKRYDRNP